MKKNKKIMGGFIAILHCLLMSIPALVLCFNTIKFAIHDVTSYDSTYVYDNNGNYLESSRDYELSDYITIGLHDTNSDFDVFNGTLVDSTWSDYVTNNKNPFPFLLDVDFLGIFDNGDTISKDTLEIYAFLNFYLNWLINMSVIVFVPELIIVFIDMCRKLVYSFSHKIDGGF